LVDDGFLELSREHWYSFAHDQIQAAALDLVPKKKTRQTDAPDRAHAFGIDGIVIIIVHWRFRRCF
jgi:hypothetical protein